MRAEELRPSHLCLLVVDVWREAEDDFGVVGVVFVVPDVDVHLDIVITCLNQHSGGKKNPNMMKKINEICCCDAFICPEGCSHAQKVRTGSEVSLAPGLQHAITIITLTCQYAYKGGIDHSNCYSSLAFERFIPKVTPTDRMMEANLKFSVRVSADATDLIYSDWISSEIIVFHAEILLFHGAVCTTTRKYCPNYLLTPEAPEVHPFFAQTDSSESSLERHLLEERD